MVDSPVLVAADVERARPSAGAPVDAAARGIQTVGYDLLAIRPEGVRPANVVLSPASVSTAFAMLRTGARGATAAEIDQVLHFPDDGLGPAYNALTGDWLADPGQGRPEFHVANSLFLQEGLNLHKPFLDGLARDFGSGVRTVDFTSADAAQVIDAWVREQTRDRIDRLFGQLPQSTLLVLANAVYLKARWALPFNPSETADAQFRAADGGTVQARTMHRADSYDYATGPGWSAVRLPYVGGQLSMWILLPDPDTDPTGLLRPGQLVEVAGTWQTHRVALALPSWHFQSDLPLNEPLQHLGMRAAFGAADFSGISDAGLWVDQVMHRADITVDEEGTEAAAATGIAMVTSLPPPPDFSMTVDHPFAFAIMHDATATPLFAGLVGDPTS
ncbi:MAG: serpin family protein [Jiangellaceae bacterium]